MNSAPGVALKHEADWENAVRYVAISCAWFALTPAAGICDGYYRCGSSLVSAEVSVAQLLQKCGNPSSTRVSYVDVRNEFGAKIGISTVETWRYDRGTRAAAMLVTVVDGKIEKVKSESADAGQAAKR